MKQKFKPACGIQFALSRAIPDVSAMSGLFLYFREDKWKLK